MKKIYTLFALFISILAHSQSTTVVISQVYSGGGVTSGTPTYKNDYVELHNVSATSQLLTGYSLQYGSNTGNFGSSATNIYAFTAGTSIPSGGYLLIQLGTVGTVGTNFPVSADFVTTNINMAAASGKIALANQATTVGCGATATACTLPNALLIDVVSYGASNNAEGGSGVNNGVALTNVQGGVRKTNGCQDTDNNNNDFTVTTNPVPRNSTSPVVTCGGPVATISATPNITNITTSVGVASASQSFNISASNLTPAAGNLSIAPSSGLEISFDNSTFFSTAQNFSYTGSAVASTPIYVRISSTAAVGALISANVTCSGGGAASNAVITVAGGVSQNFYSQPTGNLSVLATWGIATNGTGTAPLDFTSPYQIFNVVNRATAVPGAHWEVSGTASKIIVGDGITSTYLNTSITDTIKGTTVIDILSGSGMNMGSRVAPFFGNIASNTLVNYYFTGTATTDTVRIKPAAYYNLTFNGGIKYLQSGITTVNNNLTMDACVTNGAPSPFSTIVLKGTLLMTGGAIIEDSTTGSPNRFTLSMAGNNNQTIFIDAGSELRLFRLQRDTSVLTNLNINVTSNSKICVGNNTSGGLSLLQKTTGTPTVTKLVMDNNAQLAVVKNGIVYTDPTKAGTISTTNSKIIINKSITSTSYPGTLKFEDFSTLSQLTIDVTTPAKDTVTITNANAGDDVAVRIAGNLSLLKGVLVVVPSQKIQLNDVSTVTGGGVTSYVDGSFNKRFDGPATFIYPVGQAKQYAPVEIAPNTSAGTGSGYAVQYLKQAYSNLNVNPATLGAIPGYGVSTKEYWNIAQSDLGNANIKFYYNPSSLVDAAQTRIAHFNAIDWDDIGRDANGTNGVGNYIQKNNVSSFSPFTFGGAAGVLPILLQSFNGILQNNTSTLQWKTSCESAGDKFELQYSTDGINFVRIYTEDAKGTCVDNLYSYMHTDAKASVNYYRLVLKTIDGSVKFSNIIALKSLKKAFEIKLVSTNTNEQLCYSVSAVLTGNAIIRIANMQGQLLFKENIIYNTGTQIN
jgi:hypothetical protein